jgi:co-chaperonin GroES (HSP10)
MVYPINDKIFVQVHEKETVTQSGILLLNKSKKEQPRFGTVVSIGELVTDIKPGDTVAFGNYALRDMIEDYFVMIPGDLFGYFKN